MKLNHINLVISNVAEAIQFFETYFKFTCTDIKGDNSVAILKDTDDLTLVIMTDKNEIRYPDAFHIGFMLDSEEDVIKIYHTLKNGGIIVGQEPKKIRDSFGFYFNFDAIMIEVGYYYPVGG
ncbi:VOC family protein [Ferruginibacter albus]|uniref:VOC family protein n=1 Tax=Ferruginibacter albus TaxID=2875540 RepID=UPI001CC68472|nr:VOC family protein [Ferruginibacter albus]UAY53040.1 VOC family protein [Ferruginibacter albus]